MDFFVANIVLAFPTFLKIGLFRAFFGARKRMVFVLFERGFFFLGNRFYRVNICVVWLRDLTRSKVTKYERRKL